MGIFTLVLTEITSRSWSVTPPYSDADILLKANTGNLVAQPDTAGPETFLVHFGCSGACWSLDGAPPVDINSLPAGFTVLSCGVGTTQTNQGFGTPHTLDVELAPGNFQSGNVYSYSILPSLIGIAANGCGVRCIVGNSDFNSRIILAPIVLGGSYEIQQWTSDNPPLIAFDEGTTPITTPLCYDPTSGLVGPCTADLTEPWVPDTPIPPFNPTIPFIVTPNIIVPTFVGFNPIPFIPLQAPDPQQYNPVLPPEDQWTADDPFYVYPVSVPTDDGYTVNVGGAADLVFIGSPSGIYTLVKGKLNDTLYNRGGTEATIDVEIPNPFIVTGFLGD
jgi:hypothetical protein